MGHAEQLFDRVKRDGERAIQELLLSAEAEHNWVDYKTAAYTGEGRTLLADDRHNLAKAVAGFGNAGGGVIVWGVSCSNADGLGDLPNRLVPIPNPQGFVGLLENITGACTVPEHTGVTSVAIPSDDGRTGFAVTLVPQSMIVPLQCQQGGKYFYIRVGSEHRPAPYTVIAAMFGKRPALFLSYRWEVDQLKVYDSEHSTSVDFRLRLKVHNLGPRVARDLFGKASWEWPTDCGGVSLDREEAVWRYYAKSHTEITFTSHGVVAVPPTDDLVMCCLRVRIDPRFPRRFRLTLFFGQEEGMAFTHAVDLSAREVETLWRTIQNGDRDRSWRRDGWEADSIEAIRTALRLRNYDSPPAEAG